LPLHPVVESSGPCDWGSMEERVEENHAGL
jgi:hypothetical protein